MVAYCPTPSPNRFHDFPPYSNPLIRLIMQLCMIVIQMSLAKKDNDSNNIFILKDEAGELAPDNVLGSLKNLGDHEKGRKTIQSINVLLIFKKKSTAVSTVEEKVTLDNL